MSYRIWIFEEKTLISLKFCFFFCAVSPRKLYCNGLSVTRSVTWYLSILNWLTPSFTQLQVQSIAKAGIFFYFWITKVYREKWMCVSSTECSIFYKFSRFILDCLIFQFSEWQSDVQCSIDIQWKGQTIGFHMY